MEREEKIFIMIVFIVVIGIAFAFYKSVDNQERMMAECIDDARKEYECYAMIKGGRSHLPPPVIFPMRGH